MSQTTADEVAAERPRRWRWVRWAVIGAIVLVIVVGIYSATSMFWAVQGVRTDVDAATAAVQSGEISAAASAVGELVDSSTELAEVTSSFAWSGVSRLPFIGATVSGLNVMATGVSSVAQAAEPVLAAIGSAGSTTERVAALGRTEQALLALGGSVDEATASIGSLDPDELRFGLDEQVLALNEALPQASGVVYAAADAARILPQLLGMEGRRVWMVLLQNPAEARGSGGLFSGYALVEMVDGRPTILKAETRKETLDELAIPFEVTLPVDASALWGPALGMWASFNLSGNFPTVGQLAAAGMAEAGTPVDGVVALDAYMVQAVLSGTGPVEHRGVTIDGTNAGAFFTKDLYAQYPDFPDVAAKDTLALGLVYAAIDALLKRPLDLPTLLETIPPVVDGEHVKAWSPDPDEEAWFSSVGLSGALADRDPATTVVTLNNSTGGKLDAYVTPTLTYLSGICTVTSGPSQGQHRSAVVVTLRNEAPSGLPDYVDVRLDDPSAPSGSTRLQVYAYGPEGSDLREMYLDDSYPPITIGSEAGRPAWGTGVELLQGQESSVTFIFDEPIRPTPEQAVLIPGVANAPEVIVRSIDSSAACPNPGQDTGPGELMPTREEIAALAAES